MTQSDRPVEEQLRIYANAIDPSTTTVSTIASERGSRSPYRAAAILTTAAAAVVLLFLGLASLRSDTVQVETTESGQQPPIGSNSGFDIESGKYWLTREEQLTISIAELTLAAECMDEVGMTMALPTPDEWIAQFGEWHPSGILGIGRAGAARNLGYRSANWGGAGSPSQAGAFNQLSPVEREQFGASINECWHDVRETLGGGELRRIDLWNQLLGSDGTQGERWRSDPVLAEAISLWQECIKERTGVKADTPNTLARLYAFSGQDVTNQEIEIAVADVRCQSQANLEVAFYTARAHGIAAELDDDLHLWHEYGALTQELLDNATIVLAERSIEPPSLD